ncbi:hypothetical protein BD413DRAFT_71573 [Trametes elegans]|nr:hypothetical protein BD413DRAFT_71573 [Trametes elegans]
MTSQETADDILRVDAIRTTSYLITSAAVMFLYNHVVTLHEEFAQYRRPKLSGPFVLYMANRYLSLADSVFSLPFWMPLWRRTNTCGAAATVVRTVSFVPYLTPAAFSGLRAWALVKSSPVAMGIFICSLSPLIVNAIPLHWASASVDTPIGCEYWDNTPRRLQPMFAVVARVPLVLADIALLAITWLTQYRYHKAALAVGRSRSLMTVLLRDGTLYCLVLTALHTIHMTLSLVSVFGINNGGSSLSVYINPLVNILVSRFLDDLRKAAERTSPGAGASSVRTSFELRFAGDMASTLPAPGEVEVRAHGDDAEGGPRTENAPPSAGESAVAAPSSAPGQP